MMIAITFALHEVIVWAGILGGTLGCLLLYAYVIERVQDWLARDQVRAEHEAIARLKQDFTERRRLSLVSRTGTKG